MSEDRNVDVQAFLNQHPFSRYQWLIFALCLSIVLLDGFDTAAIGYIAPSLIKEWGVSKPALAPVLSAALFGLAAGALGAGRWPTCWAASVCWWCPRLVFAVACLGAAFAGDLSQLTTLRFITGVGLGAAMPNAVTLMSEYCPDKRRAMITNAMFCGFPMGAAFGGFLAAWIIPQWGWRGGAAAGRRIAVLVLVVLLVALLPESVRFMVARAQPVERIRRVLGHISASAADASRFS